MARASRTGTRTDIALLVVALVVSCAALILPSAARSRVQGALQSTVAAPLVSAQAWASRGREAIAAHGSLVSRVDSLALAAQQADPLRVENERLRALIGLGQRLQSGFVATEVVHPQRGGDENTVILAAGSNAGIRPFSPLVVPEGLIGMVTTVEPNVSTAILWTHADFRVSATSPDGGAFGIVAAHLGSGADRFLLELRGVPFRSELKPGMLIVSSGLGNVFPRGIPIGVVLRETKTIEGWARTYLLRPIVSPDAAMSAMVLLPSRAAAGVTGAWSTGTAADATQRVITAAGDSMLADSVRLVQARLAKLALLDSLRRAAIYSGDSGVRVEGDSAPQGARPSMVGSDSTVRAPGPVARPAAPARPDFIRRATAAKAVTAGAPLRPDSVRRATAAKAATAGTPPRPDSVRRATAARAATGGVPPQPPVRTDSARRATRPRPTARPDSAAARNRTRRPAPPENPFRLPPSGAGA